MIAKRTNPAGTRRGLTFWGQWLCAIFLVSGLLCYLVYQHLGVVTTQYRLLIVITIFGSVPAYMLMHVYHKRHSYLSGLVHLMGGWATLLAGLMAITYASQSMHLFSSEILLQWAVLGYLIQAAAYIPLRYFGNRHSSKLRLGRTSVIIGSGPAAYELAKRLHGSNRVPLVGLITSKPDTQTLDDRFPVLGDLSKVRELVDQYGIRRVYIALSLDEVAYIEKLYITLLDLSVDVVWIPDFGRMPLLNQSISQIEQLPAIYLNETPLSSHPASVFSKELLDRGVALQLGTLFRRMLSYGAAPTSLLEGGSHGLSFLEFKAIMELGVFESLDSQPSPMVDAMMFRKEPKSGPLGTLSWTADVANAATNDDFVIGVKELQLPDGTRRPYSIWLSGDYPRALDGLAKLLSIDMHLIDVNWVGLKLQKLLNFGELNGSFWAQVPGESRQQVWPSTVAYLAALLLQARGLSLEDVTGELAARHRARVKTTG